MYHIDFNSPNHVHFIGIGGISMSGLAEILLTRGFSVSGSDSQESELTKRLAAHGATIFYGQKAENIMDGIDVVVYTAAIHPDNPEYINNIGSYYLIAEQDCKTALKYYGKVLKKHPQDYTAIKNSILAARKMKNTKLEKKYMKMIEK